MYHFKFTGNINQLEKFKELCIENEFADTEIAFSRYKEFWVCYHPAILIMAGRLYEQSCSSNEGI